MTNKIILLSKAVKFSIVKSTLKLVLNLLVTRAHLSGLALNMEYS